LFVTSVSERPAGSRTRKRRANGEGSVFWDKRRRRWIAEVSTIDPTGKPKRVARSAKTQAEALRLLKQLRRLADEGLLTSGRPPTVAQFLAQWLEGQRHALRPRTWEGYESVIRTRLVPELGRLRLDGLTPAHLAAAYDRLLGRGLSPKSVLNTHRLLHRALSDAVRWGMLVRNPCDLVDPPRAQRPAVRALDAEEVARLLAACTGDDLGPLVTVAVLTGLRQGELLGLTWDDIDLERGELRVMRAVQRVRGRGLVVVPPKTASSRRLVPLPPQAVAALREQRRRQAEARLKAGPAWADGNWVFTTALGLPYHPSDVAHRFQRLLEHAGLPRLRFHDLRHTTASLLLGEGVHPKVVASLLGHSTIQITLDTYSHVTPGLARQAAEALGALVANRTASSTAERGW
jgi:integrase